MGEEAKVIHYDKSFVGINKTKGKRSKGPRPRKHDWIIQKKTIKFVTCIKRLTRTRSSSFSVLLNIVVGLA